MDREGQPSVYSSSEQRQPYRRSSSNNFQQQQQQQQQQNTPSSEDSNSKSSILQKHDNPNLSNQSPLPPIPLNSLKNIPLVVPQFTVPPLPLSRRRSASPDTRFSPNPARQVFTYPVSYPHDAPPGYSMSDEDGPPPSQRRRLSSPENRGRNLRSDEESDSRRGSASKGAMSYDPVHEYHQAQHHHHSRRPSSAASQHSHVSSYSAQSSNLEGDEAMSPMTGDHQLVSRDGKKRKHKCQECGQYFTRLHNLKSHLLTHSQEKPFICQECGHKFRRLHDLKRHHKLHTGERPYTCPGCNRSFARMDALNRHRKPGGECSSHNLSTSSSGQNAVERRMSLPPGFGRPASSQGSASPMPQSAYTPSESNINPALAAASHGHSYPPTHLPPKNKHRYQHREGDASPGLLAPPSGNISFGRSPPPPTFGPAGNGRGVQPPPLVIPNSATAQQGPTLSPIHSHHYSAGTQTGSSSSGGRSGAPESARSPIPPMMRDDPNAPNYSLTESPRGMTPPPIQAPPPLAVPPSSLPLLPSPGTLISPSPRNSYDRTARQSIDTGRPSESSRGYFDLIERNSRLEERVKQLESFVGILWQERDNRPRRQSQNPEPQNSRSS